MPIHFPTGEPKVRRIKVLAISADVLLRTFRGMLANQVVECEGIPEDARTVGICVDDEFNVVKLYLESAEFPEMPEGAIPSELLPTFHVWHLPIEQLGGIASAQEVLFAEVSRRDREAVPA